MALPGAEGGRVRGRSDRAVRRPARGATNSATSALHLELLVGGIQPGDEVICPATTCMATANAICHAGAVPVFAEIDPATCHAPDTHRGGHAQEHHLGGSSVELQRLARTDDEGQTTRGEPLGDQVGQ